MAFDKEVSSFAARRHVFGLLFSKRRRAHLFPIVIRAEMVSLQPMFY
jgi:hypothetical protein